MSTIKTTLHTYCFDIRNAEEKAQYDALCKRLRATPGRGRWMESHGGKGHYVGIEARDVELETAHIFDNQWNTADGFRVFDWAQDYKPNHSPYIKRGHYLDITPEMVSAREDNRKCGYCGNMLPAAEAPTFCPKCIGSEYLKESELHLLRMMPITEFSPNREPLTDAERAELLPKFTAAKNATMRRKHLAKGPQAMGRLERKRKELQQKLLNVDTEEKALHWLIERELFDILDNVIFYDHTQRFCFGWREPLTEELKSKFIDVASEFPFDYDIKDASK